MRRFVAPPLARAPISAQLDYLDYPWLVVMSARSQSEFCMDFCFSTIGIFRFSRWSRADRVLRFVDVCKLLFVGCVCAVVAAIGLQEQIWIAAAIVHSMLWCVV